MTPFQQAQEEIERVVMEVAERHKLRPAETLLIIGGLFHRFLDELNKTQEKNMLDQLRRME